MLCRRYVDKPGWYRSNTPHGLLVQLTDSINMRQMRWLQHSALFVVVRRSGYFDFALVVLKQGLAT